MKGRVKYIYKKKNTVSKNDDILCKGFIFFQESNGQRGERWKRDRDELESI